ncbi:hypothetical protein I4U23_023737 [Adineta vaga]|nr:hypothetical protein I4U23_023737 [Adineta vaga]
MAVFVLCGSNSSFSTRFYILALIALVLVCCCSYCSSTSIVPSLADVDPSSDDTNELIHDEESTYDLPYRLAPYRYIPEQALLSPNDRLMQLLIQSALNQNYDKENKENNKRYASQSFHAMRG